MTISQVVKRTKTTETPHTNKTHLAELLDPGILESSPLDVISVAPASMLPAVGERVVRLFKAK